MSSASVSPSREANELANCAYLVAQRLGIGQPGLKLLELGIEVGQQLAAGAGVAGFNGHLRLLVAVQERALDVELAL
jgi:hypothetical protein